MRATTSIADGTKIFAGSAKPRLLDKHKRRRKKMVVVESEDEESTADERSEEDEASAADLAELKLLKR